MDIDYSAALQRGAIGAIGSLPGTLLSHPFDVIKIRSQVTGDRVGAAVRHVNGTAGPRGFYRGLVPALEQRLITRGPMFLVSELYTQIVMKYGGLERTPAIFIGSIGSGFTTGSLAALAEYRKKLLSQNAITPQEARWDKLVGSARRAGHMPSIWRRVRGAGICSAMYDASFFGTEHFLSHHMGYAPALSYSVAAATAVTNAYAFDAAVAKMMVVPPNQGVKPILSTCKELLRSGVGRTYRGISARGVEFAVNYAVVGGLSTYVVMLFSHDFWNYVRGTETSPPKERI